jgi:hypothetical protein
MAIRSDGSVMSPPPGFVVRGCRRAFLAAGGRDLSAVELFAWCYARRAQRKRIRLSARDGDETFLDRRNAYRAIRKAAAKMAVKVGRGWPGGNVWRLQQRGKVGG